MCYSAQVWADYDKYVRAYGADIDIGAFHELYVRKRDGAKLKTPKAMDAAMRATDSELVQAIHGAEITGWEAELFKQAKRLADAERTLQNKQTKKALENQRIAGKKIGQLKKRLANLKRTEPAPMDSRIYPGVYAPVMVWENGGPVVKPMRYQCRPAGKPANYDRRYPGTYNARRDNLEGFWSGQFGHTHAVMVVEEFYENVTGADGNNQVLRFAPRSGEAMLVACLWSRWTGAGEDELLSFAAITDEPTPEVAAAGHDRLIVSIRPEHLEAWLKATPDDLATLYAIFDDRQPAYYEHQLAA